jgi:hypothetical protein
MNNKNTLYIAEPIFFEKLQKYDSDTSFPPVKKIGITTDSPDRRERELLGTISPVKIAVEYKKWCRILNCELAAIIHYSRFDTCIHDWQKRCRFLPAGYPGVRQ